MIEDCIVAVAEVRCYTAQRELGRRATIYTETILEAEENLVTGAPGS